MSRRDTEPYTPAEYDDQTSRWLISGFQSWNEVTAWGTKLYASDAYDPSVDAIVRQIEEAVDTVEGRVLAAVSYVQDRIRYVSTSFGEGGHRPRPPSVTFARRYGDCKDKSLLLVAILKRLGHQAGAALVSVSRPRGPLIDPPSPASFDHVIVRAEIEGETQWIDATARSQAGPLASRSRPHHSAVLLLADDQHQPLLLPDPGIGAVGSFSQGEIDLSEGPGRTVMMSYINEYLGRDAEETRYMLASAGRERLAELYLDHLSETHGAVEQAGDFEVEDDRAQNRIVIRNRLKLLDPWVETPSGMRFRYIICFATTLLPPVGTARRVHPLIIEMHPLHHRHSEIFILPYGARPVGLVEGEETRTNSAFSYRRLGRYLERRRFEVTVETKTTAFDLAPSEIVRAQRDEQALRHAHEVVVDFPRKRSWLGRASGR